MLPGWLLLGMLLLAGARPAAAWWDSEWTVRKSVTLDTSAGLAGITEPTGSIVVLVRLHQGNFRFESAKSDGSDLRFLADDDKTLLPYQIEKFDALLNEAFVWVRLPDLKPGTKTTFWLYYGNAGPKAVRVEDGKATYNDHLALVYHFNERGQPAYDATGGGNNALNAGTSTEGAQIGTGLRLDGRTGVTLPAMSALGLTEGASLTWSAWIKPSALQPNALIFSSRDNNRGFAIGLDNGIPFVSVAEPTGTQRTPAGAALAAGTWHHLAMTAGNRRITLYVDGEQVGALNASIPGSTRSAILGSDPSGGSGFVGEIDEVEIARATRTGSYLRVAAVTQGSDGAKIITLGEDEQETSWLAAFKGGYIGVIVGSLTVDGWVVIGVLGVMFVISWTVMVKKGLLLKRIGRGNAQFLKEWSHVAADLSVLENDENEDGASMGGRVDHAGQRAMRDSPIYQIYHIGTREIAHRLQGTRRGGAKVLSTRSIEAIRASLDGGLVRETSKLNNRMVLLTIAISGGPFLGLLGTVVGVMITFAAVAQAGDVNVNAIAPGIAAALLATVAGLAVAIPALFGYNYLLTQIKTEVSEMHIFIDEFVAKMAEFYSETAESDRTYPRAPAGLGGSASPVGSVESIQSVES